MRKMMSGIAAMAAVFIMSNATALAAEVAEIPSSQDADTIVSCGYCGVSCTFVDADGDGICDNYAAQLCGAGTGFVDADGDGICDNYGTYGCGISNISMILSADHPVLFISFLILSSIVSC